MFADALFAVTEYVSITHAAALGGGGDGGSGGGALWGFVYSEAHTRF